MALTAVVFAWILFLAGFVRVLFHGLRVGGLVTTVLACAGVFLLLVFLTCRVLFRPTQRQRRAAARLLGIRADEEEGGRRP